ncbi:DUF4270 domain-containing protein [Myroides albus]|uniref:DUF4270 domain-containing protein n=1 Tax=Myroides albus TaxID=2562892 RepID=UPI00215903A4|nr:DUF4270 domain-containing protein [Myroides albus]UVD80943.1 DUF4270 domain-containing protein [Myroides albus]
MNQKNIIKGLFLSLGLITLQACDSDFTETGADIIGGGEYQVESYIVEDIKAYNQPYGPTDASRLPEVSIGSYDDGIFGVKSKSIALNFATPSILNEIDNTIQVDSAYIYLPYYNTEVEKVENDVTSYKLKSRYGNGIFKLEVFQHDYLMTNDDPLGGGRKYFSNQSKLFENTPNGLSSVLNENTTVLVDNRGIVLYKKDKDGNDQVDDNGKRIVKEVLPAGMWINLDKAHFQSKLADIASADEFQNKFRGLYLKASSMGSGEGTILLVNPAQGYLRVAYTQEEKKKNEDGTETTNRIRREVKLPLLTYANPSVANLAVSKNILVNLEENDTKVEDVYESAPNKELGDDKLFVTGGGEGSIAVIELFKENDFAELKALREQNVLINDAFLTVYTDEASMAGQINPERLYLYNFDSTSNIPDFIADAATSKPIYGGAFEKGGEDSKKAKNSYTFRIKDHIQNLIKSKTLVSPKLAISASNSFTSTIGQINYKDLYTGGEDGDSKVIENTPKNITQMPSITITTPIGTVINGTTGAAGVKKMKLEIFYTKTVK